MRRSSGRFEGASLDEALTAACEGLAGRLGEIRYEIVEESEEGVTVDASLDPVAIVGLFLSESFRAGSLELSVRLSEGVEALTGELEGEDVRWLTAQGGRGLDALQYLSNRVLNRRMAEHQPVHLDVDGFKSRRAERLHDQAEEAADEAVRTGREVVLGPLTPAARRDIHLALADDPTVETESDGEGFLKRLVVRPVRRR